MRKLFRKLVLWLLLAIYRDEQKILLLLARIIALLTRRPYRLTIEGTTMTDFVQGAPFTAVVRCFDSEVPPVPVDDTNGPIAIIASPSDVVGTVTPSGTPGVYNISGTMGQTLGQVVLIAADGVLQSVPFTDYNVIADTSKQPASLVISAS